MHVIEILKTIVLGIVEGITEWLPISSTGHMILVDEFIHMDITPEFKEMFLVVIQLGAILSVVVLYFSKLFPFTINHGVHIDKEKFLMWFKIIVATIPAALVGVLFEDEMNQYFNNYQTVAIMLILFGILFIVVENYNEKRNPKVNSIAEITYNTAFLIGIFQMIAAVFPGTSRSGATIIGALLLGVSRTVAAEFTFFLAIPAMFGASLLKIMKFGFTFTSSEVMILLVGMITAFIVSILAIKFLMGYIKKNDFKPFGWYRIVLGIVVLLYFFVIG